MHWLTHSVVWTSIFAAIFTTLAVEYFAKPWLEARKDRILEDKRELRALIRDVRRSTGLIEDMACYSVEDNPEYVSKIPAELSESMFKVRVGLQSSLPKSLLNQWSIVTTGVEGVAVKYGTETPAEKVREVLCPAAERLELFYSFFTTPKLHLWRRRQLIRKINSSYVEMEERLKRYEESNSLPD